MPLEKNDQNSKYQTKKTIVQAAQAPALCVERVLNLYFGIWDLFVIWCMGFVIDDTKFQSKTE